MATPARASAALALIAALAATTSAQADRLPSWNDEAAKQAILAFVRAVTTPGVPTYVAPAERVAVFDNDGTLWCEQPMYVQLAFVLDRIRALAAGHPEWRTTQPFAAAIEGDLATLAASGEHGLLELLMATHAGMSTDAFAVIARDWLAAARHPRFERPYTELVYQPMLELLAYLREQGFKTWVVSGGGIEFMRPFTERVYGIPPEQVIGSSIVVRYGSVGGRPALIREPKVDFIDDKAGKPVGIHKFIGRRPILAFGNSDGDLQMLEWTTAGEGPRFGAILHHTDAEDEYAYDRSSSMGRLDAALAAASERGWTVVDMRRDWRVVFPPTR